MWYQARMNFIIILTTNKTLNFSTRKANHKKQTFQIVHRCKNTHQMITVTFTVITGASVHNRFLIIGSAYYPPEKALVFCKQFCHVHTKGYLAEGAKNIGFDRSCA